MKNATLAANIRALRRHLDMTQAVFAAKVGGQQANVSKWEGKGEEPSPRVLDCMARLAGVTVAQFMDEEWQPGAEVIHAPDLPPVRLAGDDDDMVEIIKLDLRFSMGPGTSIDDYIEETPVRFAPDYLRTFTRTPPTRLRLAEGVGESMFPTLLTNDLVWIDTTQTILNQQDRIWAISLHGAAAIKRLRTIGKGRILVISDNPTVENQEVDAEDLIIGGRVIRFAREL